MPELNSTQSRKTTADAIKSCDYYDTTFFDGYAWAELQKARLGLWCNPLFGNWPLVIIANGVSKESGNYIVKEYSEGTVYTWAYQDTDEGKEEYTHHLNQLRAYWSEING